MKLAIFVVALVIISQTTYRDPNVTIPENVEVRAGETAHIEVILEHIQTTMWNLKVYVDTSQVDSRFLERLEIQADGEHPIIFEEEIPHGTEVTATIDVTVAANSPAGEVRIPIIIAGSKGPCMKGCYPFLIQKSTTLKIARQEPKLALLIPESTFEVYPGEVITVEVQLKNYGAEPAYVEKVEAVPDDPLQVKTQTVPREVSPNMTESVTVTVFTKDVPAGSYLVHVELAYRDQIQNTYAESKTIYVTILEKQEPPATPVITTQPPTPVVKPNNPDEKYLYFVAGMFTGTCIFGLALMVGLFLRKRRPTKVT